MKKIATLILIGMAYASVALSQNLDKLPEAKRDSILLAISKEVVLKYSPLYYREDKEPVIKREIIAEGEEMAGRAYYRVTILSDETKDLFEYGFAARVDIWADTGKPSRVTFGNGLGRIIPKTGIPKGEVEQNAYQPMDRKILEERRKVNELLMHPIERRDNFDSLRVIPKGDTIRK